MRATAIPAQVTTVEDHIAGNLNLTQLILLCIPLFVGGLLFTVFPPAMHLSPYKLPVTTLIVALCGILAIRIKGKIVLFWAAILLRHWLRPKYYVFDKRSMYGREQYKAIPQVAEADEAEAYEPAPQKAALSFAELARVQDVINDPTISVAYEARKGALYVRIAEAKQEG